MSIFPVSWDNININNSHNVPVTYVANQNKTYWYWFRSLYQRACSVIILEDLPKTWRGMTKDFLYYCLYRFGYVATFDNIKKFGFSFQPASLYGRDFYYPYTNAVISNPAFNKSLDLKIGTECELLRLTPDYIGVFDIIDYYATQLSQLSEDVQISLINLKIGLIIGAKSKAAAKVLKAALDEINKGEPSVIFDYKSLLNDIEAGEDPYYIFERKLKENYLLTDQLADFSTILNNFDSEIGIPTLPIVKRERMIESEAQSRTIDAKSRSVIWYDTLKESIDIINGRFNQSIKVRLRYEGGVNNVRKNDDNGDKPSPTVES